MGSTPCCICLEGPEKGQMYLIACGCKEGWFHPSCEGQWLNAFKYPYSCPTCRRPVPFKTVYSFLYSSGEEQEFLHKTLKAVAVEIFLFGFQEKTSFLPSQTLAILTMPFIIRSNHALPFFLRSIWVKNICQYIFLSLITNNISLNIVKYTGIAYIGLMYISHYMLYVERATAVDPLQPYAIYREIVHSVTESPSDTLERT
jgi:hypothetical protein